MIVPPHDLEQIDPGHILHHHVGDNDVEGRHGGDIHDAHEVFARASLVRNTVEPDPNAPTLTEVRELMDEAMAEQPEEEEKDL